MDTIDGLNLQKELLMLDIQNLTNELKQKEKQIKKITTLIQKKCNHTWIKESDYGPYADKWYQCSNCGLIS